jgi:hypothetical protein
MNSGSGGWADYRENTFSTSTKSKRDKDDGTVQVNVIPVFSAGRINFFGASYPEIYINAGGAIPVGPSSGSNGQANDTHVKSKDDDLTLIVEALDICTDNVILSGGSSMASQSFPGIGTFNLSLNTNKNRPNDTFKINVVTAQTADRLVVPAANTTITVGL